METVNGIGVISSYPILTLTCSDEDSPSTSPHAETRAQKSPTSTLLSGVAASSGLPHAAANATTIVSGSSAPAKSSASTTSAESLSALSNLIDKELQLPAFPPLTQADISQPAAGEAPQQQLLPIADEVLHGFSQAYRRFAEDAIEMVRKLQFKRVYASVHTMWTQKETTECGQLLLEPGVLDKIQLWDTILYDTMLHVLVSPRGGKREEEG